MLEPQSSEKSWQKSGPNHIDVHVVVSSRWHGPETGQAVEDSSLQDLHLSYMAFMILPKTNIGVLLMHHRKEFQETLSQRKTLD